MSWEKLSLKDICCDIQTGPFGSQLHRSDYADFGIPVIMPKDIVNGHISTNTIALVEPNHVERLKRHVVKTNDIIFARRGDVGRCAFVTVEENGWICGTGCIRATVNRKVANPKFVFYQLQKPETIGWIEKHAIGSTMLNLNTSIIGDVPVELPALETQNRMVDMIDNYDDLIQNNQKQIKLLEEAAQRLYKEWFVDLRFPGYENVKIVDGVPEGWRIGTLKDVAVFSGQNERKTNRDKYKYYLPIDCLPKKSLSYISFQNNELAESSLVSFDENDIIFGAMRPYFHKVVVARDKGLTRSTCFVVNSIEKTFWSFLVMLLFSEDTVKYATQISVGTTMPYVRWNDFINMPVLIPCKEISYKFDKVIKPIIDKTKLLSTSIISLSKSRDMLLPRLMSGEVEV